MVLHQEYSSARKFTSFSVITERKVAIENKTKYFDRIPILEKGSTKYKFLEPSTMRLLDEGFGRNCKKPPPMLVIKDSLGHFFKLTRSEQYSNVTIRKKIWHPAVRLPRIHEYSGKVDYTEFEDSNNQLSLLRLVQANKRYLTQRAVFNNGGLVDDQASIVKNCSLS